MRAILDMRPRVWREALSELKRYFDPQQLCKPMDLRGHRSSFSRPASLAVRGTGTRIAPVRYEGIERNW